MVRTGRAGGAGLAAPPPNPRLGNVPGPSSAPGTASVPSPGPAARQPWRTRDDPYWVEWRSQIGRG